LLNISKLQQDQLFRLTEPHYEAMVRSDIHHDLTQLEFDALVLFVYNPGGGWPGVRAAINNEDKARAVEIIESQIYSKGHRLPGLVERRHAEAKLLLEGEYK